MTKQDEINKLNQFVESLPDGYLTDIFKDIQPMIADAIKSDFCCIPMREIWEEKQKYYKEISEFQKQKQQLTQDIIKIQREKEFIENSLKQAKEKLANMARIMLNAV